MLIIAAQRRGRVMEFNCQNCGWSKVVGSPIFCGYSEKRTFRENCCEAWKPKNNPITNADKIRQVSDEELADFLDDVLTDGWNAGDRNELKYPYTDKEWLDWLKQEVERDG